jgi:hypothetical protein
MTQSAGKVTLFRVETGDELRLLPMAKEYHDEIFPDYEYDHDLVIQQISILAANENVYMWAIMSDRQVVGVIAFVISYPIGGGPKTATELLWFVTKRHRGGSVGVTSFHMAERMLINLGADVIEMAAMETSTPDKIGGFLARNGYRPSERHYRKSIERPLDPS